MILDNIINMSAKLYIEELIKIRNNYRNLRFSEITESFWRQFFIMLLFMHLG